MGSDSVFRRGRVTVMGVLNVTPDSFSDGGRFVDSSGGVALAAVLGEAESLLDAGADVLDVGGESTRPGAKAVPEKVEHDRVVPVIDAIRKRFDVPISVDTRNAACARAALDAGAQVVNDVSGLAHDGNLGQVCAQFSATLVLGHMRGTPETMREHAQYDDLYAEVVGELGEAVARALASGLDRDQLVVDPGIGFSKGAEESLAMLVSSDRLKAKLGLPVLVGPSRKSFLGVVTGEEVEQRDATTWAACALAVFSGADAVRVHEPRGAARAAALARAARLTQQRD